MTGTIGGGTPQLSVSRGFTITNADTIFDLQGVGFQTGSSVAYVGAEVVAGTARDGTPVAGFFIGGGVSAIPVDGHGEITVTGVISLNRLKFFIGNTQNDLIKDLFNSLDDETRASFKDYGISFD